MCGGGIPGAMVIHLQHTPTTQDGRITYILFESFANVENCAASRLKKYALHVAGGAVMTPVRLDNLTAVAVTDRWSDKSRLWLGDNFKNRTFGHGRD